MTDGMGRPCSRHDPELWFAEKPELLARAQAICAHCPARASCLYDALRRREPWGVWGGEIVLRGRVITHKRGRGRPRKDLPPRHERAARTDAGGER
jgi:WhiB family redox-sensing transcriptional regulator